MKKKEMTNNNYLFYLFIFIIIVTIIVWFWMVFYQKKEVDEIYYEYIEEGEDENIQNILENPVATEDVKEKEIITLEKTSE